MVLESLNIELKEKSFITIIGHSNDFLICKLLKEKSVTYVLDKYLSIFNGETVEDEIAFGLESKALKKELIGNIIKDYAKKFEIEHLLDKDPFSLGSSDKAKVKLCNALICRSKIIVISEVLSELDKKDLEISINLLKEYIAKGGVVINVTSNIEESLYGDRLIIYKDKEIVIDGETLSVLNEEKLMKRLGLGLPFYIELSKYLIDYKLIDKYYLDSESLVDAVWK